MLEAGRRSCEVTGIELIRYLVRRRVYPHLLFFIRNKTRSVTDFMKAYLREVSQLAVTIGQKVGAPWRAPLLLCLFGTLVRALEILDDASDELERLDSANGGGGPVVMLDVSELSGLLASLASDGLRLDPSIQQAITDDLEGSGAASDEARALHESALRSLGALGSMADRARLRQAKSSFRKKEQRGTTTRTLVSKKAAKKAAERDVPNVLLFMRSKKREAEQAVRAKKREAEQAARSLREQAGGCWGAVLRAACCRKTQRHAASDEQSEYGGVSGRSGYEESERSRPPPRQQGAGGPRDASMQRQHVSGFL